MKTDCISKTAIHQNDIKVVTNVTQVFINQFYAAE